MKIFLSVFESKPPKNRPSAISMKVPPLLPDPHPTREGGTFIRGWGTFNGIALIEKRSGSAPANSFFRSHISVDFGAENPPYVENPPLVKREEDV